MEARQLVTSSGRLIAAWRAVESQEAEGARLFHDPFAGVLAGDAAIRTALQQAQPTEHAAANEGSVAAGSQEGGMVHGGNSHRRYKVSNPASRVWWFDRQILSALQQEAAAGQGTNRRASSAGLDGGSATTRSRSVSAPDSSPPSTSGQARSSPRLQLSMQPPPPRQVVVLGAGMDARPWRLEGLPEGVAWFEVDQAEVVAAKQQELKLLGAQTNRRGPAQAHPLKAASWTLLAADLCQPGWLEALAASGWASSHPTVWVLEGLLMYLTAEQRDSLLRQLAEASPAGSVLVTHTISDELMELMEQQRQQNHSKLAEQAGAAGGAGQLVGQATARQGKADECTGLPGAPAVQSEGSSSGEGEADDGAAQVAPTYAAVFSPALIATWHSGFPADPGPLLNSLGWTLQAATTRAREAQQICLHLGLGKPEGCCAFETQPDVGEDRYAVFAVARK